MSEERSIQDYLDDILNAVYGEEVRESIVGAITKCYEDGLTGSVDMIARGRLDVVEPIAENAQNTANANIWATLQAEKVLSQDGINNLNSCTETGKYYAPTATVASVIANQPTDKSADTTFAVLVLQHVSTSNIIQILIDAQWKMWIRRAYRSGTAWTYGAWKRFLNSNDLSDINTALDTKANKNNAQLTGAPVATTAKDGDNSTRIATTAYVMREANKRATKASPSLSNPTLTGTAVAPTPAASSNDTTIATTQYVTRAINNFKGTFDTAMSSTSVNAVQNKVVNTALAAKANSDSPNLYGTPTVPTAATSANNAQIANTQFVKNAIGAQATVTTTGTATKGLMSQADKIYLENSKPYSVPSSRIAVIGTADVSINTTQSRIIITNMTGSGSDRYGMVTVYMTVETVQSISANGLVLQLPVPVGTPCFGFAVRGQSGVIPAYVNNEGKLITTQAIASGKRFYFNIFYYAQISSTWR